MTTVPPIRLPAGVRDFLPVSAARRRQLAENVMSVFELFGYARVITPMFEVDDVLGRGTSTRETAIRFVEPGSGEIVTLRPDITPQIARIVATRLADVPGPIRLCYEGAVTRLAHAGQREILQAGIELIDASDAGDAEVLSVAIAVLERLGLKPHLDLGHVAPARYVLDGAPNIDALIAAIARKDRAGVRVAARELSTEKQHLAQELVHLWGPYDKALARARALPWPDHVHAAFAQIEHTIAQLEGASITIDFGEVRGFDYYTGMRFAAYADNAPEAILRGGRYDELIGRYGRPARATGFAIDLEAIAKALPQVPARPLGVATNDRALAKQLRSAGVRCIVQEDCSPEWLRGAGLDAAVIGDRIYFANDREAAVTPGDIPSLIALLKA
ncbi:MAG: ATP phosphoribosyltransferase regulatory subunit [Kofleriaceae bacterium]